MPVADDYAIFETATGFAAMGWNSVGVTSFRLPAPTIASVERALLKRLPDAKAVTAPPHVQAVIAAAQRYFTGEPIDFADVPVDLGEQDPFYERVYAYVRDLKWGEATTYGAVAKALGAGPEAARWVGQAMATNPVPVIIPCHRVTAANGKIGGFSAPGGSDSKARMLELEGVKVEPEKEIPRPKSSDQMGFGF